MPDANYPVAFRHRVPPKKNLLQSMKSRLRDIPTDREDYAVVLDFNGIYELVPSGTPVAAAEGIRAAAAMIFVDVRPTFIDLDLEVPCRGYVERRLVTVRYQSRVVSAEVVLQDRVERLESRLEYWTRSIVARDSARFDSMHHEEFVAATRRAIAHRLLEQPPVSPAGVEIALVEVSADLPKGYEEHHRDVLESTRNADRRIHDMRQDGRVADIQRQRDHDEQLEDTSRAREQWEARQPFEDQKREKQIWQQQDDAALLEEIYRRGPEAVLAHIAAGDPTALDRLFAHGIEDRNFLAKLLMTAAEKGMIDKTVVEDVLIDAASNRLNGPRAQMGSGTLNRQIDRGTTRGSRHTADADDEFDPEDDDLDDRLIDLSDDGEEAMLQTVLGESRAGGASGDTDDSGSEREATETLDTDDSLGVDPSPSETTDQDPPAAAQDPPGIDQHAAAVGDD